MLKNIVKREKENLVVIYENLDELSIMTIILATIPPRMFEYDFDHVYIDDEFKRSINLSMSMRASVKLEVKMSKLGFKLIPYNVEENMYKLEQIQNEEA